MTSPLDVVVVLATVVLLVVVVVTGGLLEHAMAIDAVPIVSH
ncbi:MAG TPA: hypothetical protein VGG78_02790 [Gemmatimonadaceae bacterium]|jgi:hypothetical protein